MSSDLAALHALLTRTPPPRILALCGAGLSASSGLPTFRGAGGLWRRHDATRLATPEAFAADPALVWLFYAYRRHMALQAQPNPGHAALAALARKAPDNFLCLTQNVDNLSQRAGHPLDQLRPLHGNLFALKCSGAPACTYVEESNEADPLVPALAPASVTPAPDADASGDTPIPPLLDPETPLAPIANADLPTCPRCASLLRPGVVWFGESLDHAMLSSVDEWIEAERVDLVLVVGTSAQVFPAASYVERGRMRGAKVCVVDVEVKKGRRRGVDFVFEGDAAVLLPQMLEPITGVLPG
ncbi:hypothetical protein ACHAQA_003358 [Verticillium albo-atrum]